MISTFYQETSILPHFLTTSTDICVSTYLTISYILLESTGLCSWTLDNWSPTTHKVCQDLPFYSYVLLSINCLSAFLTLNSPFHSLLHPMTSHNLSIVDHSLNPGIFHVSDSINSPFMHMKASFSFWLQQSNWHSLINKSTCTQQSSLLWWYVSVEMNLKLNLVATFRWLT